MDDTEIGIPPSDAIPSYTETGDREIRARNVSTRHIKILNDLQVELDDAGRREAIAALCEYYARNPDQVLAAVEDVEFR